MTISFGKKNSAKYISFIYGKDWDKGDFKFINLMIEPLGWSFNIWRLMITYDNFGKLNK